jgi:hypothetical protein
MICFISNKNIAFGHLTHRDCVLHRRRLNVYLSIVVSMWSLVLRCRYLLAEVQYR